MLIGHIRARHTGGGNVHVGIDTFPDHDTPPLDAAGVIRIDGEEVVFERIRSLREAAENSEQEKAAKQRPFDVPGQNPAFPIP